MGFVETEYESVVPINGICHENFQEVAETFAENFNKYGEIGSSICVVVDGETTVDLWAGYKDEQRTDDWGDYSVIHYLFTKGREKTKNILNDYRLVA